MKRIYNLDGVLRYRLIVMELKSLSSILPPRCKPAGLFPGISVPQVLPWRFLQTRSLLTGPSDPQSPHSSQPAAGFQQLDVLMSRHIVWQSPKHKPGNWLLGLLLWSQGRYFQLCLYLFFFGKFYFLNWRKRTPAGSISQRTKIGRRLLGEGLCSWFFIDLSVLFTIFISRIRIS